MKPTRIFPTLGIPTNAYQLRAPYRLRGMYLTLRHGRAGRPARAGYLMTACDALREARKTEHRYGAPADAPVAMPRLEPAQNGPAQVDGSRWIENPEAGGLRFVGHACDLAGRAVNHEGWQCDSYGEQVAQGVVYQLPAKRGRARFVAGMADPMERNEGAALLWLGDVFDGGPEMRLMRTWRGTPPVESEYDSTDDAKESAAFAADEHARVYAEREREWNDAWQEGQLAREKGLEAFKASKAYTSAVRAFREAWRVRSQFAGPGRGIVLRELVDGLRARCEQFETARSGFYDALDESPGRRDPLRSAWLDGYGSA